MPIYMEISRLHRTVTVVARGNIDVEEIRSMALKLAEAKVRSFAKILEVAGATTEITAEHVQGFAALLRGASTEKRGPVAFIVNPERGALAKVFAEHTASEGPVRLFTSLREARKWSEEILSSSAYGRAAEAPPPNGQTAFTDPAREGV